MLAKPDVEVVYEDGKAVGVKSEGETAKAKLVKHSCFRRHAVYLDNPSKLAILENLSN